jgi:hypothetical protein
MASVVLHDRESFSPFRKRLLGARDWAVRKSVGVAPSKSNGFFWFLILASSAPTLTCFARACIGFDVGHLASIREVFSMAAVFSCCCCCCCSIMLLGFLAACWPCRSLAPANASASRVQNSEPYPTEIHIPSFPIKKTESLTYSFSSAFLIGQSVPIWHLNCYQVSQISLHALLHRASMRLLRQLSF